MREYIGSRTQAFLPVRPAELHSAVLGKNATDSEVHEAAGCKPAGRTDRRPVFRYG